MHGGEAMTWNAKEFKNLMARKIGENTSITKVHLERLDCSSVALNELLAIIYVNISEEGLQHLTFGEFPKACELDRNLLSKIADKASNLK